MTVQMRLNLTNSSISHGGKPLLMGQSPSDKGKMTIGYRFANG